MVPLGRRIKHVVDSSGTLASGVELKTNVIATVDTPTLAATANVETGSKVNGLYLKVIVASNEASVVGAIPNVYMTIFKSPGSNIAAPASNAVGASDAKRFVIHQEMVMIDNKRGGQPTTLFNGVVVIPKNYRRNAPGDILQVNVLSPQIDISTCLQCHYKEFR